MPGSTAGNFVTDQGVVGQAAVVANEPVANATPGGATPGYSAGLLGADTPTGSAFAQQGAQAQADGERLGTTVAGPTGD